MQTVHSAHHTKRTLNTSYKPYTQHIIQTVHSANHHPIHGCRKQCGQLSRWAGRYIILPYSQSYPHDLPRVTSLSSTGGWMASYTTFLHDIKWLWRHRQTRRYGNVARLNYFNFPTFTPEKFLFGTYRRKIINIFCPLVTEKSTNPLVKLTCSCLRKPWHGLG